MYILNTSFFVSPASVDSWLNFVRDKYIPMLGGEGYRVRLLRVLSDNPSHEGVTYCLMAECPDIERYQRLAGPLFEEYRAVAEPLYGDSVQYFTTLLKDCQC